VEKGSNEKEMEDTDGSYGEVVVAVAGGGGGDGSCSRKMDTANEGDH
jgi:hypothetical protein